MADQLGYLSWQPDFLLPKPYLGGLLLSAMKPITVSAAEGVFVLPALDGSQHIQRPYRGAKAPLEVTRKAFGLTFSARDQNDYIALKRARSAQPVKFAYGGRELDQFNAVTIGDQFLLTRERATNGTIAGVDETTHPTAIRLDGVDDATAASLTGRMVTANKTGTIEIEYTPLYTVAVLRLDEPIRQTNDMQLSIDLEELISGDFS